MFPSPPLGGASGHLCRLALFPQLRVALRGSQHKSCNKRTDNMKPLIPQDCRMDRIGGAVIGAQLKSENFKEAPNCFFLNPCHSLPVFQLPSGNCPMPRMEALAREGIQGWMDLTTMPSRVPPDLHICISQLCSCRWQCFCGTAEADQLLPPFWPNWD